MLSRRIDFEKLLNTRDLGGMTGADGRKIKPGKLYRSGHLYGASAGDLEKLAGMIELSVDFRTSREIGEKPEPKIPGVTYVCNPIFGEQRAGVTRDEDSFLLVMKNMVHDAEIARNYMCESYVGFVTNQYSVSQYERFIRLLLEDHQKGVLWHCTAGKDRAGFGTIIVQEILGVSRDDILNDYLMTNICLKPETMSLREMFRNQEEYDSEIAITGLSYIFEAKTDYLNTAYDMVRKHYGTFENYIRDALHITPDEQEKLRAMYLI
ncbi:MAG: tyrosine-protein phosphatase [Anaerolineaceae bacterium]|nr:tyrosine-protein phosphatase [Anaerolineaceae bacterium]